MRFQQHMEFRRDVLQVAVVHRSFWHRICVGTENVQPIGDIIRESMPERGDRRGRMVPNIREFGIQKGFSQKVAVGFRDEREAL